MDYQILLLGALPPFLAIIAEVLNPVSKAALRPTIETAAGGLAVKPRVRDIIEIDGQKKELRTDEDVTQEVQRRQGQIAGAIGRISTAAAEVSGIIPTWISVTAGIVGILVDKVDASHLTVAVAIWTAVSAIFGIFFFSQIDYYSLGYLCSFPFKRKQITRQERLSRILIGANLVVIAAAVAVSLSTHASSAAPGPGAQHH